jgi:anti-anti-sigma factor
MSLSVDAPAGDLLRWLVFEMVLIWSNETTQNRVGCLRVDDRAAVLCLRGELDLATTPDMRKLLDTARATPASSILVDLREVSFIDAPSVGELVAAWSAAAQSGQQLRVTGLANQPARVFEILGLRGLLVPRGPEVGTAGRTG